MKMLTANRLTDGEAVWLAPDGSWAETIAEGRIAHDKSAEAELEQAAEAARHANEVVDIALIDVDLVDGEVRPLRLRERIRAAGPTIHPDLGKQAAGRVARLG